VPKLLKLPKSHKNMNLSPVEATPAIRTAAPRLIAMYTARTTVFQEATLTITSAPVLTTSSNSGIRG